MRYRLFLYKEVAIEGILEIDLDTDDPEIAHGIAIKMIHDGEIQTDGTVVGHDAKVEWDDPEYIDWSLIVTSVEEVGDGQ